MSDPVIALDLRADASWPPSEVLRHDTLTRSLPPGQIYLNATRTAPNERKLWEKMRGIAIRYGIATP
jgi:hypothetical protein